MVRCDVVRCDVVRCDVVLCSSAAHARFGGEEGEVEQEKR